MVAGIICNLRPQIKVSLELVGNGGATAWVEFAPIMMTILIINLWIVGGVFEMTGMLCDR